MSTLIAQPWVTGIPDWAFEQKKPRRGLITKAEVRVVSLSKMRVAPDAVVWDIGTGSGSVSVEAARLAPRGQVWTIEKNEEDVAIARRNVERFGVSDRVRVIHGRAPEGLEEWPAPNAVFVGGSAGAMRPILETAARRLLPGGRIVANVATVENLHEALNGLRALGMGVEITLLQVARSRPILDLTRFEALDPVYILTAGYDLDSEPPEEAIRDREAP